MAYFCPIVDQTPSSWLASTMVADHVLGGNRSSYGGRNSEAPINTEQDPSRHTYSVSSVSSMPFVFPNNAGSHIFPPRYYPHLQSPAMMPPLSNTRVHAKTPSSTKDLPHKVSQSTKHRLPVKQALFDSASLTAASSLRTLAKLPGASNAGSTDSSEVQQNDSLIKKRQARKCKVEHCINTVVQGGLCISHGAKRKLCGRPGCDKKVKKAGMCSAHGPARKKCEHENCANIAVQGGLCISHGAKKRMCSIAGCNRKARAVFSQMCKRHHDEGRQQGTSPYSHDQYTTKNVTLISPGSSLSSLGGMDAGISMDQLQCYPTGNVAAR